MPSSGDAHIDFTEEVTPDKGSLNKLAKTFIPFILLFLTKAGYQFVNFIKSNASQKDIKLPPRNFISFWDALDFTAFQKWTQ